MTEKLSRLPRYVLRHQPGKLDLELEVGGWVRVDRLLESLRHGTRASLADLERIVERSDKQRFALSEDGTRMRANQAIPSKSTWPSRRSNRPNYSFTEPSRAFLRASARRAC